MCIPGSFEEEDVEGIGNGRLFGAAGSVPVFCLASLATRVTFFAGGCVSSSESATGSPRLSLQDVSSSSILMKSSSDVD